MPLLMPRAGRTETVYGGEKKRRSKMSAIEGAAWKEKSAPNGILGAHSGRTRLSSICLVSGFLRIHTSCGDIRL
jgi:hypothetical protein